MTNPKKSFVKKSLFLTLLTFGFCSVLQAQFYREGKTSNYYSLRSSYIENHPGNGFSGFGEDTSEGGEFSQFQRWQWFWGPRLYPHGDFQIAIQATQNYINNYNFSNKISQVLSSNWQELGPLQNSNPTLRGIGRITSIAFDPIDPANIMYAGGTVGGVWKTTNGGQSWSNLNTDQQLARLGVSTIAIDPVLNPGGFYNIYAGTGEVGAPYSFSDGVYRSQDGGQTWQPVNAGLFNSQTGYFYVPKLLIDPSNNNVMYAATSIGIFKTTNR